MSALSGTRPRGALRARLQPTRQPSEGTIAPNAVQTPTGTHTHGQLTLPASAWPPASPQPGHDVRCFVTAPSSDLQSQAPLSWVVIPCVDAQRSPAWLCHRAVTQLSPGGGLHTDTPIPPAVLLPRHSRDPPSCLVFSPCVGAFPQFAGAPWPVMETENGSVFTHTGPSTPPTQTDRIWRGRGGLGAAPRSSHGAPSLLTAQLPSRAPGVTEVPAWFSSSLKSAPPTSSPHIKGFGTVQALGSPAHRVFTEGGGDQETAV